MAVRVFTVMVRNGTAYPQTLKKKIPVARVVAANLVPELQMWPGMIDTLDEAQGVQAPKMTTGQRQEKLFEKLDLSVLESWPPELTESAHLLLAEYHNIFSLESSKCQLHSFNWTCDQGHWQCAHLKNNSGRSLHPWWKKSTHTYERCLDSNVQFTLVRVHGVMLWYWSKRRMGACAFA